VIITYTSSVKVDAGWRSIGITARAVRVSAGMCQVEEVLEIDGQAPAYGQSRTGAKRQEFNGHYWARQEVGKKKRISSCEVSE
jgi:hypothetical protein